MTAEGDHDGEKLMMMMMMMTEKAGEVAGKRLHLLRVTGTAAEADELLVQEPRAGQWSAADSS